MAATLHIDLLGDFRLLYGETPVTALKTARLQSLLAYLVLQRNAPQPRSKLAFLFWPDSTEAQAHTNLRNLLHHLRRALPEADLLPGCYEDWVLSERERLRQAFIEALDRLIRLLESWREYGAAIGYAQRLLRHDPLHEAAYRRLMRLRVLSGDRAAALRVYHTCATALQRELGVNPSPATHEAYERLLNVEALPGPPQAATPPASPLVGRDFVASRRPPAHRSGAAKFSM